MDSMHNKSGEKNDIINSVEKFMYLDAERLAVLFLDNQHFSVNQIALNMRVAVHSVSLAERLARDLLKLYQERVVKITGVAMALSKSSPDDSLKICGGEVQDIMVDSVRERAAVWETSCDIFNSFLANISEQLSMTSHMLDLATGTRPSLYSAARLSSPAAAQMTETLRSSSPKTTRHVQDSETADAVAIVKNASNSGNGFDHLPPKPIIHPQPTK